MVAVAAALVMGAASSPFVAGWVALDVALVGDSECGTAATALLCVPVGGGSAAAAAATFNHRETATHPKKAIARTGLDKN